MAALLAAGCSAPKADSPSKGLPPAKEAGAAREPNVVKLDRDAQREAKLTVAAVRLEAVPETIHATGRITVNENRTWRVGSITDGRIVRIEVNVGDQIVQGQILARIFSHDVHESRAEYQKAAGELARAQANELHTQRLRDRARRLYALKAASLEQVEHAEAEFRNAQATVRQALVELERTRTHLADFLGVALEEPAHNSSGQHNEEVNLIPIKSPAAGVLLERNVTPGTVVATAGQMFVVSDLSSLWMLAAVSEEYFSRLRTGMAVKVRVQAHPGRAFPGRITRLGEQLDPATRTVQARIELANSAGLLKPEMYADAELLLPGTREALFIPEVAVQEVKGNATVFVRRSPDTFEAVAVQTGRSADGWVEILGGLKAGDEVAERGSFTLKAQFLRSALTEE